MAGSRRKFRYESDTGVAFVLTLDESNGEASNAGGIRITGDLVGGELNKPSGFTPRYVLTYLQSNPAIKRKFVVGDPDTVVGIAAVGNTIQAPVYANADGTVPTAATWVVTSYRGEKIGVSAAASAVDTGLTDGDAPN